MKRWRMFMALASEEVVAIRDVLPRFLPPERYGLVTEVFPDGGVGESQMYVEVTAESELRAISEAQHCYDKFRQAAQLNPARIALLGYTIPTEDDLLHTAGLRAQNGHHEEAVVLAQAACEVLAAEALKRLLAARGLEALAGLYKGRPVALRDDTTRLLFNTLAEVTVQQESWWQDYETHASRRQDIVHRGLTVNRVGADASVAAAGAFTQFVRGAMPPSS